MFIQCSSLVIGGFEDRGTTHRRFGGGYDGKILAGEAQEYFPIERRLAGEAI